MLVKKATGKVELETQQAGFTIYMCKRRRGKVRDSHIGILVGFPYHSRSNLVFHGKFSRGKENNTYIFMSLSKKIFLSSFLRGFERCVTPSITIHVCRAY